MRTDLFDFELPPERIALRPAEPRDNARLLVVRPAGVPELDDRTVADLPALLAPGDQVVVNDTKVIAASLTGRRVSRTGEPKIEATLIKRIDGSRWRALAKPARKLAVGDIVRFGDEGKVCFLNELDATIEEKGEGGEITLSFAFHGPVLDQAIAERGEMPLPPYIASRRPPDAQDRTDYQTLFAHEEGAVAAPTAGLHFTPSLLEALRARGIGLHTVTLHVGAGTFLPVKAEDTRGHRMHAEWGSVSAGVVEALNAARRNGGRVVAVGSTSLRLSGKRRRRGWNAAALRGRDRDFHHPRLSVPRRRYPDDQFPFAALDLVHAGVGVLRARCHETRLRACDRARLSVLFVWRCEFAVPSGRRLSARREPQIPSSS